MERTRYLTMMALFIAMAVALHWAESFLPRPLPFVRLGLANIFTLCALYLYGGLAGVTVLICRVLIGSIMTGTLFSPIFFFSFGGGLAAAFVMWLMPRRIFSPLGVSVAGAAAHMLAQALIAALLIRHLTLVRLIPLFILSAVITGCLNGYCANLVLDTVRRRADSAS